MNAMVQDYDIYADETFLHGSIAFAFGAIICTRRRTEILSAALNRLRVEMGITSEIKWKNTTSRTLPFYRKVIDTFFDDKWPRFSVLSVSKGPHWRQWARSEEERFFKSYYVFLMRNAGPFSRYRVFLDQRSVRKGYRWRSLHFFVNRARRVDWGLKRRNIRILTAIDSKASDVLQVADLLLGCATSDAMASAKRELREHFALRRKEAGERVRSEKWSPHATAQQQAKRGRRD